MSRILVMWREASEVRERWMREGKREEVRQAPHIRTATQTRQPRDARGEGHMERDGQRETR